MTNAPTKSMSSIITGSTCSIAFQKSRIYIVTSLIDDKDFIKIIVFEGTPREKKVSILKSNIVFMEEYKTSKLHKIVLNYQQVSQGIVEKIEGKFIILSILNTKTNKRYHNLIPIRCITGIKVMDEIDEDVSE